MLNYEKKDSLGWELETTPTYRWSEVHTILKVVGKVSGSQPKWPIYVYLTDILKELPRLQKMDEERKKKEDLQRKDEREKIKQGNPNDMTITLLREILDEMGKPFKKSWKKTVKLPAGHDITSKNDYLKRTLYCFSTAHCVWLKLKQIRRKQI